MRLTKAIGLMAAMFASSALGSCGSDNAESHHELALSLHAKGEVDAAIAEWRAALRIKPDHVVSHYHLGLALSAKGQTDEATAEFRSVIHVKPDHAGAHYMLGWILNAKGDTDEAIAEYRAAISSDPDHAEAHCNLGHIFLRMGNFTAGLELLKRGHNLGSSRNDWSYPSALWVREAERMVAIEPRLTAVREGKDKPKNGEEYIDFANACRYKQLYGQASAFYERAFELDAGLADEKLGHIHHAAGSAAAAGFGQGKDDPPLAEDQRAHWHKRTLEWVNADLEEKRRLLESDPVTNSIRIRDELLHLQSCSSFAASRDAVSLATLPASTRNGYFQLWSSVDKLIKEVTDITTLRPVISRQSSEPSPFVRLELRLLDLEVQSLYNQGRYEEGVVKARQVVTTGRKLVGERHPDYARGVNNLGEMLRARGDFLDAKPLFQEVMGIYKDVLGERHPAYAMSLNNMAILLADQGDYAGAKPLFEQALAINKEALGERDPAFAQSLNNLASLLGEEGDYAAAKPLLEHSLIIRKQIFGERHPIYAGGLDNLATLLAEQGDYAGAKPLFEQALAIRKEALGERHPDYALSLDNFACMLLEQGDYAAAKPMFEQALAIRKESLGERHPDYPRILNKLALMLQAQGDYATAKSYLARSWDIIRHQLDLTAVNQSERQQLVMAKRLRSVLDAYLCLAAQIKTSGEQSYGYVLAGKGIVFEGQHRSHVARQLLFNSRDVEVRRLFEKWQSTIRELATWGLAGPDPNRRAAWQRRMAELTEAKDRQEEELQRRSAVFRSQQARSRPTPADVQALLPTDTALVDFLQYTHSMPPPTGKGAWPREQCVAAFVVRPGKPVVQCDLGPAKPIEEAVDRWLTTQGQETDVAAELRHRVWEPLQPHLEGAKTVLVSPDGALARLPFAALPGKAPGTYLIEEVSLGVVPVPQLLPELLAAREAAGAAPQSAASPSAALLLVGNVDFGAQAGEMVAQAGSRSAARSTRAGALGEFAPLEATTDEILAVRDAFEERFEDGRVALLRKAKATEAAVRQEAPRCRYLHLATHGFFAPKELRSALAPDPVDPKHPGNAIDPFGGRGVVGFHPGLLSGLVLAGANRPAQPGEDDGILTALEVAGLDLDGVDLAVLSACETGLGEVAGGEGLLGLQRAFQVAGARSVVASLWKVGDEPTRALMSRFYRNLWTRRMGRLEALREAQLWMLREGRTRGLVAESSDELKGSAPARVPPKYWAAFVLSGDWR